VSVGASRCGERERGTSRTAVPDEWDRSACPRPRRDRLLKGVVEAFAPCVVAVGVLVEVAGSGWAEDADSPTAPPLALGCDTGCSLCAGLLAEG
jgi:hypothetical protein